MQGENAAIQAFPVRRYHTAEKVFYSVIPSGARNLSFFVFLQLNQREIPRSAQNDRNGAFFRSLGMRDLKHSL
jgi:hypothetical protein